MPKIPCNYYLACCKKNSVAVVYPQNTLFKYKFIKIWYPNIVIPKYGITKMSQKYGTCPINITMVINKSVFP